MAYFLQHSIKQDLQSSFNLNHLWYLASNALVTMAEECFVERYLENSGFGQAGGCLSRKLVLAATRMVRFGATCAKIGFIKPFPFAILFDDLFLEQLNEERRSS